MARTRRFLGESRDVRTILSRFLPKAFRRPVGDATINEYVELTKQASRLEDGLHLALRRALVSPDFLYRGLSSVTGSEGFVVALGFRIATIIVALIGAILYLTSREEMKGLEATHGDR